MASDIMHIPFLSLSCCNAGLVKITPVNTNCAGLHGRIVEEALGAVAEDGAEFMIASHNQASVERAVELIHERGLDHRTAGVFFGQLLGMADPLSFVLGASGYRVSFTENGSGCTHGTVPTRSFATTNSVML